MIWALMIATGLANFAARISVFSGLLGSHIPPWAELFLRFVPTSVLSAIIAASLFVTPEGPQFDISDPRIIAALIASCVALVTRSVIATLLVGLSLVWWLS